MRQGSALLELLTATVLLMMLAAACAALIRADAMVVLAAQERSAVDEAHRIAAGVLSAEYRTATSTDTRASARDSLSGRVFRGFAIVCAQTAGKTVARYRGLRAPDAAKDSILIAGEDAVSDFRTTAVGRSTCPAGQDEEIIAMTPARSLPIGAALLFFETGSYYLSTNALRYRRGGEGRQPLTEDRLREDVMDMRRIRRINPAP
jgi:hypothetical protein